MRKNEAESGRLLELLGEMASALAGIDRIAGDVMTLGMETEGSAPGGDAVGVSLAECRMLEAVRRHYPANGVFLARRLGFSKGGISKMAARLARKGLLVPERPEGDRKSVQYRLTPAGGEVCALREKVRRGAEKKLRRFLSRYSAKELRLVTAFLEEASAALRDTAGLSGDRG